jgi:tocopherol cyclase-like protein
MSNEGGLMKMSVDPNAVRFDRAARRDHVESYFLKANAPSGDRALWIKATIFASAREPDRAVAEGWAIAFDRRHGKTNHVAIKHSLPLELASFSDQSLDVRWTLPVNQGAAEQSFLLRPGQTSGQVARREQSIRWDLRFDGEARPMVPFPHESMYRGSFPKSKVITPYPDLRISGEVSVGGERWELAGWHGMQGHNWGRGHADLYAWCHVNAWEEQVDFVLEALSGRVRVGPLLTPLVTLVCARYRGVDYSFNGPITIARAHGDVGLRRYGFSAEGRHARIEGQLEADTEDMVGLYYPNPDGAMTYCLNSKLGRAHLRFEVEGRPPIVVRSRAAALEIGTREPEHGVRMYV